LWWLWWRRDLSNQWVNPNNLWEIVFRGLGRPNYSWKPNLLWIFHVIWRRFEGQKNQYRIFTFNAIKFKYHFCNNCYNDKWVSDKKINWLRLKIMQRSFIIHIILPDKWSNHFPLAKKATQRWKLKYIDLFRWYYYGWAFGKLLHKGVVAEREGKALSEWIHCWGIQRLCCIYHWW